MNEEIQTIAARLRQLLDSDPELGRAAIYGYKASLSEENYLLLANLLFGSGNQIGDIQIGDVAGRDIVKGDISPQAPSQFYGPTIGVNLGTITYTQDSATDERQSVIWYLEGLSAKLLQLPLRGLDEQLNRKEGLSLPSIYVMLATKTRMIKTREEIKNVGFYFEGEDVLRSLKPEYDPEYVLPDKAYYITNGLTNTSEAVEESTYQPVLERALLAFEAVLQYPRLVLLGDPGSGKSTFIRYLAWSLAQHQIKSGGAYALINNDHSLNKIPIILPLRILATNIAKHGTSDETVFNTLSTEILAYYPHRLDDFLSTALSRGSIILLFDGLDEVPLEAGKDYVDRFTVLRAVHNFSKRYAACSYVITLRTRAFEGVFADELGWHVETIAPFTMGQIRHFAYAWYKEMAGKKQIEEDRAQTLANIIITNLRHPSRKQLREMASNPLLLTLIALNLYNKGDLPRDRPQLYERILDLLLGQWDQVRDNYSLGYVIGKPEWDSSYIMPLLDQLSYLAHTEAQSEDGRGRLKRGEVYAALIDFFRKAQLSNPGDTALRFLDYVDQRSGLLQPDTTDTYVFAHLTFQEYCAGRKIALHSNDPVGLFMRHRHDDRWREPILLGVGRSTPLVVDRLLMDLVDQEEAGVTKPLTTWYRDLILAAEIGSDRDWDYLRTRPTIRVDRLQRQLRKGLVSLLENYSQPLSIRERIRAAFLLGVLGDPRFPISLEDWHKAISQARDNDVTGYLCRVSAGSYTIGSPPNQQNTNKAEQPEHIVHYEQPFWIARYPITNSQWKKWVDAGGHSSAFANDPDLNGSNQPLVGVSWNEANAFCSWISHELGIKVRLPTEAEWEAAARGPRGFQYPWGDEWIKDRAATSEDRADRDWLWSVPVGCYPTGQATCGAYDMAGNVWEWTADEWRSYPGAPRTFMEKGRWVLRGGAYSDNMDKVKCMTRYRLRHSGGMVGGWGFRVIVEL